MTFLVGYVAIALMLPAIWLGFAVMGRRPGLLSSVEGRLRWPWIVPVVVFVVWVERALRGNEAQKLHRQVVGSQVAV